MIHGAMCIVGGGITLAISILSFLSNFWFGLFASIGMLFGLNYIREERVKYWNTTASAPKGRKK